MRRLLLAAVLLLAPSAFAADAALCEKAINNLYGVMYASPKDAEKLKNPKVQAKKAKEIASCTEKMSAEKASCFEKMKAMADLEPCAKMK